MQHNVQRNKHTEKVSIPTYVLNDYNADEIVLFSNHGIVFVLKCINISDFMVRDFFSFDETLEKVCIDEFEITFTIGNVWYPTKLEFNQEKYLFIVQHKYPWKTI